MVKGGIINYCDFLVVTECDSSNVEVRELESGNKSVVFSIAHTCSNKEITCIV